MLKSLMIIALGLSSLSAFALTGEEFESCSAAIKKEIVQATQKVYSLEDTTNASDDLINALTFSIPGTIYAAPSCESLRGMARRYSKIATELKK